MKTQKKTNYFTQTPRHSFARADVQTTSIDVRLISLNRTLVSLKRTLLVITLFGLLWGDDNRSKQLHLSWLQDVLWLNLSGVHNVLGQRIDWLTVHWLFYICQQCSPGLYGESAC